MTTMNELQIESGSYLISTSFKSFGFIINDTETKENGRQDNFFENFRFAPEISAKLFKLLCKNTPVTIYATDENSNGFLFFQSEITAGVFAFIKRIDINPDEAATIIRESFSDRIVCLNGGCDNYSEDAFLNFSSMATRVSQLLENDFSDAFIYSASLRDTSQEYVFSPCGFSLFLYFIRMTKSNPDVSFSPYKNGSVIVSAQLITNGDRNDEILKKLGFVMKIMDLQNLNIYYTHSNNEIKISFFPYYIDDGLHGVKAPINFEEL